MRAHWLPSESFKQLEPGYLHAVVSACSHYRIEIREERASFQVECTGAIRSTIGDPRLHARAGGAHPGDSHSEYPASIHLSEFEEEVRDVFPQCCLHLGGRALTRQGHLYGCARDHDDDVEGWHFLAHILYQDADRACWMISIVTVGQRRCVN
eukprot:scaffold4022_cov122-Isochrysis_galbana.AAC.16